ncbi:sulfotransferase [Nguyenibacter vanlangensis]|uniref:Sulfotransferase n=1 Tax=Nguyenibacter vanlangensis TaxID=1216886 RepID=A0A7Y7ITT7_9PROT|nr:sulfotransferase [Nguyenibacter vanlangensis]NVN10175.1 sulfotransferase [Nguyenibacter vanlangensis]
MPTILVTGLPRSGTTLLCALLNAYPDTLALGEPLALERHGDRARAVTEIERFVAATRRRAIDSGLAMSKHVDGTVPDNWVEDPAVLQTGRLRRVLEQRGEIPVGKPLAEDFHLVIKHPAEFTALAEPLGRRFPLYALVRHPLAVLAAWQTVEMPVHYGHMPMMECFVPGLTARLDAIEDRLARQVELMRFLYGTYARFPADRILRYEDILADPVTELHRLVPHVRQSSRALAPYDPAARYTTVDLAALAEMLRPLAPVVECFYPDFLASLAL